jgi:hypothetical protein
MNDFFKENAFFLESKFNYFFFQNYTYIYIGLNNEKKKFIHCVLIFFFI